MTNSLQNKSRIDVPPGQYGSSAKTRLGRQFMASASITVMSTMLSVTAQAQFLPAGCTPSPATAGDTVTCEGEILSSVATNVDDITIVVGDGVTTSTVTESSGNAIDVTNTIASGDVSVSVLDGSSVTGGGSGIFVNNSGFGRTTILAADSTGDFNYGISATGGSLSSDLSVTSTGTATGGFTGVYVRNYGTGTTTIDTVDSIGGPDGFGIDVLVGANSGDLSLTSTGIATGNHDGIVVRNYGAGNTFLNVNVATGIYNGINTYSNTGATTITLGPTAVVTGQIMEGILANSAGANANITIQGMSGDVVGGTDGINIVTAGADILVDNLDSVTGQNGDGIDARSNGGSITVSAVDTILGTGGNGIYAVSSAGNINIEGSGLVGGITGTNGDGIFANAYGDSSTGGNITIGGMTAVGDVTGSNTGILAFTSGGSSITVNSSAGSVTGGTNGISATNLGTGAVSISSADVTGTSDSGIIAFSNTASTGDLTINSSAGTVSGGNIGIGTANLGSGATSISVNDVTGGTTGISTLSVTGATTITLGSTAVVTGQMGEGILASSTGALANITVQGSSGDVIGATDGINIVTAGADILVDNLDSVTGNAGDGIDARSYGGSITVNAVDTILGTGGNGIYAYSGGGDISVQGSGLVGGITGTGAFGNGITANASGGIINLGGVAALGDVTGSRLGIYATTNGAGGITIDSTAGTVSGYTGGIDATIASGNGSISVSSADVNSTGANSTGISARIFDASSTGDITLDTSAGTVTSSGRYGISARNYGTGAISVTSAGVSATGAYSTGIRVSNTNTAGTGDLSIDSSAGAVSGVYYGIYARNSSTGGLSVISADLTGSIRQGIRATNANTASTGNLTIDTTAGAVSGGYSGIYAFQSGTGGLNITSADVTGTTRTGILARNYNAMGTGDLNIDTSAGSVTGGITGISTRNMGSGATTLSVDLVTAGTGIDTYSATGVTTITLGSTAVVTGTSGAGILAASTGANADITVQGSSGDVIGATDGINIATSGSDILVDNLDSVTGQAGDGIDARSYGGSITVNAVDTILGTGGNGIYANSGGGDISVQGSGLVGGIQGTGNAGIFAFSSGGGTGAINIGGVAANGDITGNNSGIETRTDGTGGIVIDTSAGTVTGGNTGINALNYGSGPVNIVSADVTGTNVDGINTFSSGGAVTVDSSAGDVSGGTSGISVRNFGTGATSISTNNTTGAAYYGISANNGSTATDLTITSTGTATGGNSGIRAESNGTGATSVTAVDTTGTNAFGIQATNEAIGTDIAVNSTGTATGGIDGISVGNSGSGTTTINAVDTSGGSRSGIDVSVGTTAAELTIISTGTASGGNYGIYVRNSGIGATTITAADSTGTATNGIFVYNENVSTDIILTSTGTAMGGLNGIRAQNAGIGSTSITAVDTTGGTYGAGISVTNGTTATDLTVTSTGTATGGTDGINALNDGTGATIVTAADTFGTINVAILARNGATATDLTVNSAGTATGALDGIQVTNNGSGTLSITSAAVTGNTGSGIVASNAGTDLIIVASGDVVGGNAGIVAFNNGTGAVSVDAGNVTGMANAGALGDGILATTNGTDAMVNATGTVSGYASGIAALNSGSGAVTINAVDVTGTTRQGIFASNSSTGTDITVTSTGTVTGNFAGIGAYNSGTGSTIINAVDTNSSTSSGIRASAGSLATDVTVNSTGSATGDIAGILATNGGTGATTINAVNATATGVNSSGIAAFHFGTATDITVNATGDVTAESDDARGIYAAHFGTAAGNITINANNVSAGRYGILSRNFSDSGDITVTATGDVVSGTDTGIYAGNGAGGNTVVNANTVTSSGSDGILAANWAFDGLDVNVTATGDVSGAASGIRVFNFGTGSTDISANNTTGTGAYGYGAYGIFGFNGDFSQDLSITSTGDAQGESFGIGALNNGTGATTITANTATGTGTANYFDSGIWARTGDSATDLSITTAGDVSGGVNGIFANHRGTGNLALNIGGDVTGGENGVVTLTRNGTDFTVAVGQTITGGTTGIATMAVDNSATSNDTLDVQGTVNGDILMFEGDDSLTLGLGSAVNGALRGGDGSDTLNFNTAGGLINNSGAATDGIAEFEIYNFNGGDFILDGMHSGLSATNFNAGNNILFGALESTSVLNAFGASLQVADGASITGDLTNAGRLGVNSTGIGTLTINGDFTQTGAGVITLGRTGIDTSDLVSVSGDVNLAGTLNLNQDFFFADSITLIDGGTGLNGTFDTVTGLLPDGLLLSQTINYDVAAFDVNLVTTMVDATTINGLNPNQASVANALTTELAAGTIGDGTSGGLDTTAVRLGRLDNVSDLTQTLDEVSPEIVDTGLQIFQNSQLLFMTSLLDQPGTGDDENCVVQTVSLYNAFSVGRQNSSKQMWGSIQFSSYDQDGGGSNFDYQSDGYEINTGINGLRLGAADIGITAGFAEYKTDSGVAGSAGQDEVKTQIFRVATHGRIGLNEGGRGLNSHLDGAVGFATGSNDIDQNVEAPSVLLSEHQTADPDADSLTAMARFTVGGQNGNEWAIKPYVLAAIMGTRQDAFRLGTGATAVNVDKVSATRSTFGYGARLDHKLNDAVSFQLDATGMHHFGDTQTELISNFEAAGARATAFNITGKEIKSQYLIQGTLGYKLDSGLKAGIGAFGEFGDLEGFGGRVTIAKSF